MQRLKTGFIASDDFTSLSAWGNLSGKWSASASPALLAWDAAPNPLLSAGQVGSNDYDGVREAQLFIDDDAPNTWWMLYDAGDNTNGWQPYLASSVSKGQSWSKWGTLSPGLSNGIGGSYAAVANGWLEKRGGTYYLHRVTATSTFASPDVGLPAIPYFGDIWTAKTLPGPWTFLRAYGGSGLASTDLLPGSVVLDSGTYYLVSQGADPTSSGLPEIILQTASSPGGPYTVDSRGAVINPGFFTGSRQCENPKVFWHGGLGHYAVLLNLIAADGLHTDANAVVLNDNILNWPTPKTFIVQNANGATDSANAIGVACHVTRPEGRLHATSDGYVPFTFDGDARASTPGWHRGRHIKHAMLEPCRGVLTFGDATSANYNLTKSIAHGDFTCEFAIRFANNTTGTNVGFWYRQDSGFANGYRCVVRNGETILLQKVVGGSVSNVIVPTAGTEALPGAPYVNRIRVSVQGSTHQVYQDGRLVYTATDATFATGTNIALSGFAASAAEVRGFRMYQAAPVTIQGVGSGQRVSLLGAGGLPYATVVSSGNTVTLPSAHFPLHSVSLDGQTVKPDDGGLLWGGDVLVAPNARPRLARRAW